MRLSSFLSIAVLTGLAASQGDDKHCLTFKDAQFYTDVFGKVLSQERGYKDLARKYFAKDLISSSDSFSFANELPMNQSLTSRDAWLDIVGKMKLPAAESLHLSHTCDTIAWYHEYRLPELPVRCINIMTIDMKAKQIKANYWELNAAALLYQNGKPECERGFKVDVGRDKFQKGRADCSGSRPLV